MLEIVILAMVAVALIVAITFLYVHQNNSDYKEDKISNSFTDILKKVEKSCIFPYKYQVLLTLTITIVVGISITFSVSNLITKNELVDLRYEMYSEASTETKNTIKATMIVDSNIESTTMPQDTVTEQNKYIGEFRITVYCACEKCCGEYALNRPTDGYGKPIVKGASGRTLIPLYSIATDPKVIPTGKKVIIGGKEYRADDIGGKIKGNIIDIYCGTDHSEALRTAAQFNKYEKAYWS